MLAQTPATTRFPFPAYPSGWFAVAFSDEIRSGRIERRRFAGEEVVIYRTRSGQPVVMAAHCPHMGAHLGFGGRVVGEHVRCPMHGFEFDSGGACVRTGYDTKPPPTCRARSWPVRETHGAVFAWCDADGRQPWFDLPDANYEGWTPIRTHCFSGLRSHPQETTENSIDIGHFAVVHGYENVSMNEPLRLDGARLSVGYHFERRPMFRGGPRVAADFRVDVYGLGFSFVEVSMPSYGLRTRNLVLPTPIDGECIDLRIGLRLRGANGPMRAIPAWLMDRAVGPIAIATYVNDVRQDYVERPPLAEGDGPVPKYRRWAGQFYRDPARAAAE
jgi:nitrite reductase/ring-hydroxylating ferredoxin subunit